MLVIPGYIIGLSCLFIVTYRTMIAFFSDSKSVIIHVNRFGEQYLDIISLVVIWSICLGGLLALFWTSRKEKTTKKPINNYNERPTVDPDYYFLDISHYIDKEIDKKEISGVLVKPSENFNQNLKFDK